MRPDEPSLQKNVFEQLWEIVKDYPFSCDNKELGNKEKYENRKKEFKAICYSVPYWASMFYKSRYSYIKEPLDHWIRDAYRLLYMIILEYQNILDNDMLYVDKVLRWRFRRRLIDLRRNQNRLLNPRMRDGNFLFDHRIQEVNIDAHDPAMHFNEASRKSDSSLLYITDPTSNPEEINEKIENLYNVNVCINSLKTEYEQNLFIKRHLEERTIKELAEKEGCPPSTMRDRIDVITRKILACLKKKYKVGTKINDALSLLKRSSPDIKDTDEHEFNDTDE